MRREHVAVLGRGGVFEASLIAALEDQRWLQAQYFCTADLETTAARVKAFGPNVVIVVRSASDPIPPAVLCQMEQGVPIMTLDPGEPVLTFSLTATNASATLDKVMNLLWAARTLTGGKGPPKATLQKGRARVEEVRHDR